MIEKIKQPIRVSVVDDEEDLLEILSINLKSEGYEVQKFISGNQFLNEILNGKDLPDLVLLDIMMDGINGLDVCRKMRMDIRFQTIPVIFLTAKTGIKDKIQGLEWGGDDYITKPFNIKELLLRVKAVLKRIPKDMEIGDIQNIFTYKDLTVKRDSFLATLDDQSIKLTKTEFHLLLLFLENPGRFFPRQEIIDFIWTDDTYISERTVDVHIQRLRKKLKHCKTLISTYSGVGYGYFPDKSSQNHPL